jgi:tetratricopeptide (TPR) repeat protein
MGADDWAHVNDLVAETLERPPAERSAFIRSVCGADDRLRERADRLIALDQDAAAFFSAPFSRGLAATPPEETGLRPPQCIGRYEIRRVIATGGMGIVYEAVQDHPHRVVALKVLRRELASARATQRFLNETEILGRLQHPGIARIHDAGILDESGGMQPYFAMELVEGRSLIAHCDGERLDVRSRLELFAKVCDAVQHAHQHGIVHRDLKPENILVDERGDPKILDFGIARATDADLQTTTLRTHIGELIGTVPYMSPEQVAGDPGAVDSRTDVYALGVLLYELLCGRRPHELGDRTIPEAVRVIQEQEPTRLSAMGRTFRGDLETIAGKAIAKEKSRRYQTAAELAADVRRHLAHEPIVARPASTVYQLGRFVRRNRALAAGLALTFVALVLGTAAATWQAIRAQGERDRAMAALAREEAARREAEAVTAWMEDMLAAATPGERGHEVEVRTILDDASRTIARELPGQPTIEARLRYTMARAYNGLGLYDEALEHAQRSVALRRGALGDEHEDTLATRLVLAKVRRGRGESGEAERLAAEVLETCRRVLPEDHPVRLGIMCELGLSYFNQARTAEAEEILTEALRICRESFAGAHPQTMQTLRLLSAAYSFQGRGAEAEALLLEALAIRTALHGEKDLRALMMTDELAMRYRDDGRLDEAAALAEPLLSTLRETAGEGHQATLLSMYTLGSIRRKQDRCDEAEALVGRAHDGLTERLGAEHKQSLWVAGELGRVYECQGRLTEAEETYRRVLDAMRRSSELGAGHGVTQRIASYLARLYERTGRVDEAEKLR